MLDSLTHDKIKDFLRERKADVVMRYNSRMYALQIYFKLMFNFIDM